MGFAGSSRPFPLVSQRSGDYLQLSRREKQLGDGGKTSSLEGTVQAQKSGNRAWNRSEDRGQNKEREPGPKL